MSFFSRIAAGRFSRCIMLLGIGCCTVCAQKSITISTGKPGITISPTLYGVFFEDINWAADGGLYAEMIQNRSFEYINIFGSQFTPLTSWSLVQRGGASASMAVVTTAPLNSANPHYLELKIDNAGSGAGVVNTGYGGIAVASGSVYNASLWGKCTSGQVEKLSIAIEKRDGTVLGTASIDSLSDTWSFRRASITINETDTAARLVVTAATAGTVALDMISLFPATTFKNRTNGLRADLVQRLADMSPKFVRFPGGCIVHSNDLATAYRWKTTIGPVEQRKTTPNRWGYLQSGGLGFFEFFQLCEDIGAEPLSVLPCGVSCHFKTPYQTVPLNELQPWIDDALDLIEYANGPATSTWGAKRAQAGHPEPFNMKYIGVGNEEWGPEFKERSTLFIDAIRAKYPSMQIVGTSGPYADGTDFTDLWSYNRTRNTELVDEHYYQPTTWFLSNHRRYDTYSRTGPKVFAGEYASRTPSQKTLSNAIAEAAFMTGLERNGDVVRLSSYAPLFCHVNCNGAPAEGPWNPDLIYFNHYRSYVTPSYRVQALFANNIGQLNLPVSVSSGGNAPLFAVASSDTISGDIILKVVNSGPVAEACTLITKDAPTLTSSGIITVLTGKAEDVNTFAQPEKVAPVKSTLSGIAQRFVHTFPATSVSVLRLPTRPTVSRGTTVRNAPADAFSLTWNGSNPRELLVHLTVRQETRCGIRLVATDGRTVAVLANRTIPAGSTGMRFTFDGNGGTRAPGMYCIEVRMGRQPPMVRRLPVVR